MLAAGAVLVLAAACSSSSSHAQPVPLVEKSSAIAAGDAVCKQLAADLPQMVSAFRAAHPAPSDADTRDFLINTLLPRVDVADGDIHRIGEPSKDRPAWDAAVIALDNDVSALKASVGTDPQKVVATPIVVYDTSARLFANYGFKECGKK